MATVGTVEHSICWKTPGIAKGRSHPFKIRKIEYHLELVVKDYGYDSGIFKSLSYYLYLKSDRIPDEPFDVSVQLFAGEYVGSRSRTTIREKSNMIWSKNHEMQEALRSSSNPPLQFWIVLIDNDATPKKEDKFVQTPAYSDANFEIQSLSRDLSKWLEDGPSTDVELVCGGRTFTAHRSLLSLRSDVFGAMLRSDMTEGRTGRVQIEDVEAEIFQQFLRYLYKGTLGNITVKTSMQLYKLGDKYDVVALKRKCASFLSENLAQDNACGILSLADRYGDRNLKEDAILFILDQKVPQDENWSEFCMGHPVLAIHVLNRFCALQTSSNNN